MFDIKRRQFIQKGLIGSALFSLTPLISFAQSTPAFDKDSFKKHGFLFLDEEDIKFFKAICPIMLGQVSSKDQWPPEKIMFEVIKGVDYTIAGLPESTQSDLANLFKLLSFRPTRFLLTGVWSSWESASYDTINSAMDKWSGTGILMWRSAYDGLRKIVLSSWYATPTSWQALGYPGPPSIG